MLTAFALLLALTPTDSLDARQADLIDVVRAYTEPVSAWDSTTVRVGWADVSGDGRADAVVVLNGDVWCDGDACTALLFEAISGEDAGELGPFRPAAEIGGVRIPIHIVDSQPDVWCDLLVTGSDGQLHRLAFDGETYPHHVDEAPPVAPSEVPSRTLFAEAE